MVKKLDPYRHTARRCCLFLFGVFIFWLYNVCCSLHLFNPRKNLMSYYTHNGHLSTKATFLWSQSGRCRVVDCSHWQVKMFSRVCCYLNPLVLQGWVNELHHGCGSGANNIKSMTPASRCFLTIQEQYPDPLETPQVHHLHLWSHLDQDALQ